MPENKLRLPKGTRIKTTLVTSANMQMIPACGTFGHERIVKEIRDEFEKKRIKEIRRDDSNVE